MNKMNLFAMGLLASAAVSFTACSNDDAMSANGQQPAAVDGFYMTLQVKGSANNTGTRTEQKEPLKDGTTEESSISDGTIYIYNGSNLVFTKVIGTDDWKTTPTQAATGVTKPIKVSVNSVNETDTYNVYFLANNTSIDDPLKNNKTFTTSKKGGADYAQDNKFVMFNQNDESRQAAHSTVKFEEANKSESKPAEASVIYLDRVVARIDAPTVTPTTITSENNADQTKNIDNLLSGVKYESYAVSNLINDSYVMQNWTEASNVWTLNVPTSNSTNAYYLPYKDYGTEYQAAGLTNFKTNAQLAKTYAFENTTNDTGNATALYFCIKANLKDGTTGDFSDGTFYRYDNKMYTKISDILADNDVAYPFVDATTKKNIAPEDVVKMISDAKGNLVAEDAKDAAGNEILPNFRKKYTIEVYRAGNMYYRYAINDNYYQPDGYYSILRNSIYDVTVTNIYDLGKDVPNGEDKNDKKPNYYMNVKVAINKWVLNNISVSLK